MSGSGALAGLGAVVIGPEGPFGALASAMLARAGAVVRSASLHQDDIPAALDRANHASTPLSLAVICAPEAMSCPDTPTAMDDPMAFAVALPGWIAGVAARIGGPGAIAVLAGPVGLGAWPGWVRAGAATAACLNIVQAEAVALAPLGLRINALVPGVTEALAARIADQAKARVADVRARIPTRQFMTDTALEDALLFLLHPSSSFISGEVLPLDGGWNAWGRLDAVAAEAR